MASRDSPPRTLQPKTCIACGSRGLVLTDREIEVLRALADGLSDSEIGAKLHMSRKTAFTHRANIQLKMGQTTLPTLLREAYRHGVVALF